MAHAAANLCPPNGIHFFAPAAEIEAGRDIGCNNNIEVVNNFHGISSVPRDLANVGVTEVIAWLTEYSINYSPAHDKVCSQRAPDTGRWFSKMLAYKLWAILGFGKYRNLECVGIPGAGKTTMASMVIEDLQDGYLVKRGLDIVLYAYFRHDTQAVQTIPIVLASLVVQVIKQTGKISSDIRKLYQDYYNSSNEKMTLAVNRMVKILQRELSRFLRVYIVVDALDEYSLPNYSSSHALVVQLQRLNARLLITSRYPVIFAPNTFSTLEVSAHIDDIRIVLQTHLAGHLATIVYDTPGLLEEILDAIVTKSAGMFIVAKLLISCISSSSSLTANDLRAVVSELPTGIDDTYDMAMTRIQAQEPHLAELGTRALYWVYFSKRRLTVIELRHALSFQRSKVISQDDVIGEDRIRSACAGLISFVKLKDRRKTVLCQFSHFTTREFLDKTWWKYFLQGERYVTETCLRYLAAAVSGIPPDVMETARRGPEDENNTAWRKYCDDHNRTLCGYAEEHLADRLTTPVTRTPGLLEERICAVITKAYTCPLAAVIANREPFPSSFIQVATLLTRCIRRLTINDLCAAVNEHPTGIEDTYEMALSWIRGQEPHLAGLGMDALAWVYFCKRRLRVTELQHALSFQHLKVIPGDNLIEEDQILAACCGLIAFVELGDKEGTVECQYFHSMMREILDKTWQEYFPDGERQITETCLGYLAAAVSGVPPDVTRGAQQDFHYNTVWQKYCQDHGFALCAYAMEYWPNRARAIDEAFDLNAGASFFRHPISPYTADEDTAYVWPTKWMAPDRYWILYLARFGLLKLLQKRTYSLIAVQSDDADGSQIESVNYSDIRDELGRTALHFSALGGHPKVVEFLLDKGADVNSLSFDGESPLHYTVQAGSSGIAAVQLLLDRGANVDQPNPVDRAPISYAIESRRTSNAPSPDIIRLLLRHEINIYRADSFLNPNTPLSLARRSKNPEIKQLLEEYARTHPPKPRRNSPAPNNKLTRWTESHNTHRT